MQDQQAVGSETPDGPDDMRPDAVRPLRFFGMGIFVAWLCCTHIDSIYPLQPDAVDQLVGYGMRVGDIGTFVVLALLAKRTGPLSGLKKSCSALVALCSIGTALIGLLLAPQGVSHGLLFAVSVATAIGGAILFCLWAEVYCQLGTFRIVLYGAGSCIVAWLVYLVVSVMEQPFAIVATSLLPLISLACVWSSFRLVPVEHPHSASVSYPIPWRLVAIMTVAGIASGLVGTFLGEASGWGAVHRIWATALVGFVVLCFVRFRPQAFDLRVMAKSCMAIAIVALLITPLMAVAGSWVAQVVSFLVKLGYVGFTVFSLMVLAHVAFRYEIPSLRLFAVARACSEGGIFAGVLVRNQIGAVGVEFSLPLLCGLSMVGILLVLACALIWRSEKAVNEDWGAAGISLESGERVMGERERLALRCESLAEEYGLTARETEVLNLLGQGKTRLEMEQELFLSQNTVKTHLRHLYAKLGVHSKEEVCELLDQ